MKFWRRARLFTGFIVAIPVFFDVGLMLGLPTAVIAGPLFGRFIAGRIKIDLPVAVNGAGDVEASRSGLLSFRMVMVLIVTPLC